MRRSQCSRLVTFSDAALDLVPVLVGQTCCLGGPDSFHSLKLRQNLPFKTDLSSSLYSLLPPQAGFRMYRSRSCCLHAATSRMSGFSADFGVTSQSPARYGQRQTLLVLTVAGTAVREESLELAIRWFENEIGKYLTNNSLPISGIC